VDSVSLPLELEVNINVSPSAMDLPDVMRSAHPLPKKENMHALHNTLRKQKARERTDGETGFAHQEPRVNHDTTMTVYALLRQASAGT